MTTGTEKATYEQFQTEWLSEIEVPGISALQKGRRFAAKLVAHWLNVTTEDEDFDICDGSHDGGIDIAYLQRADVDSGMELSDSDEGDIYYIVQSKYGAAFAGANTIRLEGEKILDALEGEHQNVSADVRRILEKIEHFLSRGNVNDRIVLIFATLNPISENDRQALDDMKYHGQQRITANFDVEEVSLRTIWEANVEDQSRRLSVEIDGKFVDENAGLHVGMVSLIDLFKFIVEYKNKTGNLDQLFEKNVRQYLGIRRGINKRMQNTLIKEPHLFGLYNNGVTIVAADCQTLSERSIRIDNPYVVNGCQTTRTIWDTLGTRLHADGSVRSDSLDDWKRLVDRGSVVIKIVKNGAADMRDITTFTNSQTGVRAQDFIALEDDYIRWQNRMKSKYNVFLEIQRGGTEARIAYEKQHPGEDKYDAYVNAFDLIKVYGAGWLEAPGPAFGKNAPFLSGGSIFLQVENRGGDQPEFGEDDLYAAYLVKLKADEIGFGRGSNILPTRRISRFLFYYVVVSMLRDVMRRHSPTAVINESSVTEAVIKLTVPGSEPAFGALCEAALEVIDEYLTDGSEFAPAHEPSFDGNLNTFLKSEVLGKREHSPSLIQLLTAHNTAFGVKVGGDVSRRDLVAQAVAMIS